MGSIISSYYFKILHEYNSIKISKEKIYKIILFQANKVICLSESVSIYNIQENELLYNFKNNENYKNIELFDKDKFIIFNSDKSFNMNLFKYIENINKCSCKLLSTFYEISDNILTKGNKIIFLKEEFIFFYELVNNQKIQLQMKITIPKLIIGLSYHKAIFLKNKLIIIQYKNSIIQLMSSTNYKLIYEDAIKIDKLITKDKLVIGALNKKDILLLAINNYIYLYSFLNKEIVYKIYINYSKLYDINLMLIDNNIFNNMIQGIFITKNEDIYFNDKINIYTLDLKRKKAYKLLRKAYNFNNSLIIFEKNEKIISIINSSNEIKLFKASIFITLAQDLKYFLYIFLFLFSLKYFFPLSNLMYIFIIILFHLFKQK